MLGTSKNSHSFGTVSKIKVDPDYNVKIKCKINQDAKVETILHMVNLVDPCMIKSRLDIKDIKTELDPNNILIDAIQLPPPHHSQFSPILTPVLVMSLLRQCQECTKRFKDRKAGIVHFKQVHNQKHCPVCFHRVEIQDWNNHMIVQHSISDEKSNAECFECRKSFTFASLYNHISKQHLVSLEKVIPGYSTADASLSLLSAPPEVFECEQIVTRSATRVKAETNEAKALPTPEKKISKPKRPPSMKQLKKKDRQIKQELKSLFRSFLFGENTSKPSDDEFEDMAGTVGVDLEKVKSYFETYSWLMGKSD